MTYTHSSLPSLDPSVAIHHVPEHMDTTHTHHRLIDHVPCTDQGTTALPNDLPSSDQPTIRTTRPSSDNPTIRREGSRKSRVQRIHNYIIHQKTLGAGSMGKVKLAECITDSHHQKYAVKIMPKVDLAVLGAGEEESAGKDPKDAPRERELRTIREMAIMHLLRHPNICQLKEWITEGDQYYMFLEYVDGGQLLDYIISHGKLREKQARKFARQIVSALDYCHRNSIVHRDLKIENILITQDEEIKIIDFGLSNIYSPNRLLNTFCGSLYFAAPELLQAKHYTGPEVDVWSFGVVLYVLVCGRVPFDDTSLPALHKKIKAGQVEYPEHLSKDCVDLLSKILVVDPAQRESLSFVRDHPWMNKGYDEPICNHLPHRQPIQSIDMEVVEGMHGFGWGSPEDIRHRLEQILSSTEYQSAAAQVERNYHLQHTVPSSSPSRWRRTGSIKRSQRQQQISDDPQSLPAMYDPLVSIYYLVKERKEYDERARLIRTISPDLASLDSIPATAPRLSPELKYGGSLLRRKTDRTVKSADREPAISRLATRPLSRAKSVQNPTERPSKLLERSKSAAKRFGSILASHSPSSDDKDRLEVPTLSPASSLSAPLKKTFNLLRSQSLSDRKRDRFAKTEPSPLITREKTAMDGHRFNAANHAPTTHPRFIEDDFVTAMVTSVTTGSGSSNEKNEQAPKVGVHPKSLFNFNRRHLFRVRASDMMAELARLFPSLEIIAHQATDEPFTFDCVCPYPTWQKFLKILAEVDVHTQEPAGHENESPNAPSAMTEDREPLKFTVMIYQARWAGGRLGIKVKEAEDEATKATLRAKAYRNIYHTLLDELGKKSSA
ncbi:kinase-like domain-containing protein [Radiomyces spectabilis]|uniref:kinase-like domain-containing protein n=1 Tax=Radiomyces spectabilis TaxID=64574 RepID=UPI00221E8D16|nr:kinase-like domain-containing protein [Radiomyces spectabilis]KAI8374308.1 kinase-like domain-containing protein [Radiomyces spectabilis]